MRERIFLAGASGAVGTRLVPLLVDAGYEVHGTTRSQTKVGMLTDLGARALVVDAFDPDELSRVLLEVRPSIVMSQLTDLPNALFTLDQHQRAEALERNARMRKDGVRNLVNAAIQSGAGRFIAQSIAWVYAPGREPHTEDDPLNLDAVGTAAVTVSGVVALERMTLESPPLVGTVLRYGQLYGPGTGNDGPAGPIALHVDAAASAALLVVQHQASGIFNFADPSPHVSIDRAKRQLGWDPGFRLASPVAAARGPQAS